MDYELILSRVYSDVHDAIRWVEKLNAEKKGKYLVVRVDRSGWQITKVA